jgi:uncharacterized integral membrane protein
MTVHPEPEIPVWKTRRFRLLAVFGSLAVLALVLILQNFDTTEVQFLFWTARAPLAWVLVTFMALGAGVEVLIRLLVRRRAPSVPSRTPARRRGPGTGNRLGASCRLRTALPRCRGTRRGEASTGRSINRRAPCSRMRFSRSAAGDLDLSLGSIDSVRDRRAVHPPGQGARSRHPYATHISDQCAQSAIVGRSGLGRSAHRRGTP